MESSFELSQELPSPTVRFIAKLCIQIRVGLPLLPPPSSPPPPPRMFPVWNQRVSMMYWMIAINMDEFIAIRVGNRTLNVWLRRSLAIDLMEQLSNQAAGGISFNEGEMTCWIFAFEWRSCLEKRRPMSRESAPKKKKIRILIDNN